MVPVVTMVTLIKYIHLPILFFTENDISKFYHFSVHVSIKRYNELV